jgi:hypothetical protein
LRPEEAIMLQVMANTMLLATGWNGETRKGPDFGQDHGPVYRPLARDAYYAPDEDKADRLRRMRAAVERFAPTETLRRV